MSINERNPAVPQQLMWLQQESIEFCKQLEEIASKHDHHIALTGGCLYKMNLRKDLDIIIYSVRQSTINIPLLFESFEKELGLKFVKYGDWQSKARTKEGKYIDFLVPESIKNGADDYE